MSRVEFGFNLQVSVFLLEKKQAVERVGQIDRKIGAWLTTECTRRVADASKATSRKWVPLPSGQ